MSIGTQIKKARLSQNLTQKQLADLIGVTKNAVTNYERDTSSPKEPILFELLRVLHVDANYLFQDYMMDSVVMTRTVTQEEADLLDAYSAAEPAYREIALKILLDNPAKKEKADIS